MRIVKQMIVSNQTRRLRAGNCRMPWDIFNEVAVIMVGKVRAEKAGWKPCFKILGKFELGLSQFLAEFFYAIHAPSFLVYVIYI